MMKWEENDKFVVRYNNVLTKENQEEMYNKEIESFTVLSREERNEVDLKEVKEYGLYYTADDWGTYVVCIKKALKERG